MNTYSILKDKHQKEINAFPLGFAFSNSQFEEMKIKLGVTDNKELLSIGSGGYMRKTDREAFEELLKRHATERKEAKAEKKNREKYLYDMFYRELANHEYCITFDPTDTLNALDMTIEEIGADEIMRKAWKKAILAQTDY